MIKKSFLKSAAALLLGGVMVAGTAQAAEFEMRQASDLDDLLKLVKVHPEKSRSAKQPEFGEG